MVFMVFVNLVHLGSVDLNLLVVLHELLRTPSAREVAMRLGRTPSAISHALRRLRKLLGDPLFVRVGPGLQPTARARALAPQLDAILREVDSLLVERPFEPSQERRRFVVGCSDFHELVLWPRLLSILRERAPGIEITSINRGNEVERTVLAGELDLAIAVAPDQLAGLRQRTLFHETFVVVMRRGHPLAGKRLTLKRYIEAHHALVAPRGLPGSRVDALLAEQGLSRHVAVRTANFVTAPLITAQTDLLLTLPSRVATELADRHALLVTKPPLPIPGFSVVMIWADPFDADPANRWLRERIAESSGR